MINRQNKLENLSTEDLGKLFPIEIVPYDKRWVDIFRTESELIKATLTDSIALRIEHVGSTAVEGLSSKPTIDILIEIPPIKDELKEDVIEKMNSINYHFIWRTDETIPYMHFVKGYTINGISGDVFHVHMGDKKHPLWDRIYFRDYLRQNIKVAKEYESLKISLAEQFKYDREAYTNAKSEFVKKITEIAKNENGNR
jgi:GrpB-like predicted nucleotidyltransferase (UPF0157 family)